MRPALNVASALAAFAAAWFWWRASQQPPPTSFELRSSGELDQGFQAWVRSSARANKHAALSAGIAALLQGVASVTR